ncbi:hypothetical protein HRG_001112 [Hirsutella rhossiliensis]|uniref:Uncharacterized protein n=1 Tax=Hirsutella rhossiliensis TaxID=111463 RepID=A0A9P8N7W9_9HYPO|nr:uncharacterized protein HRG_01112 [Hirsutella rhossiliensis]KAH0968470.1 hypothetical protein HRG_01112 [Hirsutella rhossiliensis]
MKCTTVLLAAIASLTVAAPRRERPRNFMFPDDESLGPFREEDPLSPEEYIDTLRGKEIVPADPVPPNAGGQKETPCKTGGQKGASCKTGEQKEAPGKTPNGSLFSKTSPKPDENEQSYDDIEPAPLDFTPVYSPSSLNRKVPKVDGSENSNQNQTETT